MDRDRKGKVTHIGSDLLSELGIDPGLRVDDSAARAWERNRRLEARESFAKLSRIPRRLYLQWAGGSVGETAAVVAAMGARPLVLLQPSVDRVALAGAMLAPWDTDDGCKGMWVSTMEHCQSVMRGGNRDAVEDRVMARMAETRVILALDGLGAENEKLSQIVDRLLMARLDGGLTTVAWCAKSSRFLRERYPGTLAIARGDVAVIGR